MSTTTLTNVQDQSTEVSGFAYAVCRDWDSDPTGKTYAFCGRDAFYERFGYYADEPPGYVYWQPMDIPVPLGEAVAELARRGAERAGRDEISPQAHAEFVAEFVVRHIDEQTALKYELEGYAHPDFVARYWDRYQSGDPVAVSLVKGAVDSGRRERACVLTREARHQERQAAEQDQAARMRANVKWMSQ